MKLEAGIKWMFMDLNSFFASVEQQENPHLRGRPVAVIPMDTDFTCVIAASYEAKAYGIKTGVMVKQAREMCHYLQCVPAHHEVYVAYHHKIIEEVAKHTPINKICSIDELSSRLPPGKQSIDAASIIAKK
jgi:DNA polymerase-4